MSPNSPRSILHALILLAAVASASPALAKAPKSTPESEAAKPMVTYRMVLMEDMAKTMKLANMVASGQVDRTGDLAAYAAALQSAPVGEVFPAGTGPDVVKTWAKATLWTDPEGFAKVVKTYEEKAAAVSAAAQSGDMAAAKTALTDLDASCDGCHNLYRTEE